MSNIKTIVPTSNVFTEAMKDKVSKSFKLMDDQINIFKSQMTIIPDYKDFKGDTFKGTLKNAYKEIIVKQKHFWIALPFMFTTCLCQGDPIISRWVVFLFGGYSAISNDSLQTLGAFICANKKVYWFYKWMFVAGIFLGTNLFSWLMYDQDISHERLSKTDGFQIAPTEFNQLQVASPVFLLLLTKIRVPVSTSFLLLALYVGKSDAFVKVVIKSLLGQAVGFGCAIVVYISTTKIIDKYTKNDPHWAWRIVLWASTCFLWATWLTHDMSNLAVTLPRKIPADMFICVTAQIMVSIMYMLLVGGEGVQKIVEEKSKISDTREASLLNFIYAIILVGFKEGSSVPMSTTWVFIGLITGREIAMALWNLGKPIKKALLMGLTDLIKLSFGLIVSMVLAVGGNKILRDSIFG